MLNQAEKFGWIESTEVWLEIRALRNVTVHEYTDADLAAFIKAIKEKTLLLLAIAQQL